MIRIFIGSDVWQKKAGAEDVLEYSIRKHASEPVGIHWMRAGDNFPVCNGKRPGHWNLCREPNQAWPKTGHGTDFSVFRCAVPELAGFTDKAIYLDVDMLVLGDIAELWNTPQRRPYLCNSSGRTEVAVIQCEPFKDALWWPRISTMAPSGVYLHQYRDLLLRRNFLDQTLTWDWNTVDKVTPTMKLLHYSAVPTQPYRPYPTVAYKDHPIKECADLWFKTRDEANAARASAAGS